LKRQTTAAVLATSVTIILCAFFVAALPCCADPVVVRGTEGEEALKWDALVLSQGTSTNGFINQEMEAKILAALTAIRAKWPEAENFHPFPKSALDQLHVSLTKEGKQIIEQKLKGNGPVPLSEPIEGDTGIRELDSLNAKYGASSVVSTFLSHEDLLIHFKNSLDIP
jgi:hypothetical protein